VPEDQDVEEVDVDWVEDEEDLEDVTEEGGLDQDKSGKALLRQ